MEDRNARGVTTNMLPEHVAVEMRCGNKFSVFSQYVKMPVIMEVFTLIDVKIIIVPAEGALCGNQSTRFGTRRVGLAYCLSSRGGLVSHIVFPLEEDFSTGRRLASYSRWTAATRQRRLASYSRWTAASRQRRLASYSRWTAATRQRRLASYSRWTAATRQRRLASYSRWTAATRQRRLASYSRWTAASRHSILTKTGHIYSLDGPVDLLLP
ncbi:hypothetical protein RRG08_033451 [Elysia crispata]|uniref:Uncharacterized protein n=1 Tax=Elysia crispata TaxID=231223 RepID=A0AAE1E4A1_9GAST|nr:hypothetical protein RRG08_033451 [Elysia crispata]